MGKMSILEKGNISFKILVSARQFWKKTWSPASLVLGKRENDT